jgi:hypothetical protein
MNLGEFRALFLGRLNRDDCNATLADGFLAEALLRVQRELRAPFMERSRTTVPGPDPLDTFPLPIDHLETMEVLVDNVPLERMTHRKFLREVRTSPSVYARVGRDILVKSAVPAGVPFTLWYYAEFAVPVVDTDTNELLQSDPDVALYAALSVAGDHFQHEKTAEWEARYVATRDALQVQSIEDELRGGPQVVSPMYHDPGV